MSLSNNLALRKTMQELVADRDTAVRLVAEARKLLDIADDKMRENGSYGLGLHDVETDTLTHKIDADFWRLSFKRTGMTQIMDAKATKQLTDSLERDPPAFSMENIEVQYLTMYQEADQMFRRGIYEVFRNLDYSYWNNNHEPYQLSAKNIVGYLFDTWSANSGTLRIKYQRSAMVNDIDRCVKVLTGRKHEPHELETKINDAMRERPWVYEDDDYLLKGFKNGNGHLTIKRPEVLRMLNTEIAHYCNHAKLAA